MYTANWYTVTERGYAMVEDGYTLITPLNLSEILNHAQIGLKLLIFTRIKAFGEGVYNLIATTDKPYLNVSLSKSFMNKVEINFDEFGVSMFD